jgi:hypothetical protein
MIEAKIIQQNLAPIPNCNTLRAFPYRRSVNLGEFYFSNGQQAQQPELSYTELRIEVLSGEERKQRGILATGDFSFVLTYKNQLAYVASFSESSDRESLEVLQLQGEGRRALRVASQINCEALIAQQLESLLIHPNSPWGKIIMPQPVKIPGITNIANSDQLSATIQRYVDFAQVHMHMVYNQAEQWYEREIVK